MYNIINLVINNNNETRQQQQEEELHCVLPYIKLSTHTLNSFCSTNLSLKTKEDTN